MKNNNVHDIKLSALIEKAEQMLEENDVYSTCYKYIGLGNDRIIELIKRHCNKI